MLTLLASLSLSLLRRTLGTIPSLHYQGRQVCRYHNKSLSLSLTYTRSLQVNCSHFLTRTGAAQSSHSRTFCSQVVHSSSLIIIPNIGRWVHSLSSSFSLRPDLAIFRHIGSPLWPSRKCTLNILHNFEQILANFISY